MSVTGAERRESCRQETSPPRYKAASPAPRPCPRSRQYRVPTIKPDEARARGIGVGGGDVHHRRVGAQVAEGGAPVVGYGIGDVVRRLRHLAAVVQIAVEAGGAVAGTGEQSHGVCANGLPPLGSRPFISKTVTPFSEVKVKVPPTCGSMLPTESGILAPSGSIPRTGTAPPTPRSSCSSAGAAAGSGQREGAAAGAIGSLEGAAGIMLRRRHRAVIVGILEAVDDGATAIHDELAGHGVASAAGVRTRAAKGIGAGLGQHEARRILHIDGARTAGVGIAVVLDQLAIAGGGDQHREVEGALAADHGQGANAVGGDVVHRAGFQRHIHGVVAGAVEVEFAAGEVAVAVSHEAARHDHGIAAVESAEGEGVVAVQGRVAGAAADHNVHRLADALGRVLRIGHLGGEGHVAGGGGAAADEAGAGVDGQPRRQATHADDPTIRPGAAGGLQQGTEGHTHGGVGQQRSHQRQIAGIHVDAEAGLGGGVLRVRNFHGEGEVAGAADRRAADDAAGGAERQAGGQAAAGDAPGVRRNAAGGSHVRGIGRALSAVRQRGSGDGQRRRRRDVDAQ